MNIALRKPRMTRKKFFDWAEVQDIRHEFDGFAPVAMTGGTANHSIITLNIHRALHLRLRGTGCRNLGPDAGVATIGDAVRYPDALVTCSGFAGEARLIPGVVVVFEVLSPTSGRVDRIEKLLEYRAVASILRYVIVELTTVGLTVFSRAGGDQDWAATALTAGHTLAMPEIGVEVPVVDMYEGVAFAAAAAAA